MNTERLQLKGQLADVKKKYKNLDIEASGLILLIRNIVNPYADEVTSLKIDEAEAAMDRLQKIIHEMRELKEKIKQIEDALYG